MNKQASKDPRSAWELLYSLLKNTGRAFKQQGPYLKPYRNAALVGTPLGIAAGIAHSKSHDSNELEKVKYLLAAQELQHPTGDQAEISEALNKTQNVHPLSKLALAAPRLTDLAVLASPAIPGYMLYDYMREQKAKKGIDVEKAKQTELGQKYDQLFQQQLMDELKINPEIYQQKVKELQKVSIALPEPAHVAGGMLAAGMGTLGFLKGKASGDAANPDYQKVQGYRKQLEQIMRMRDRPTYFHTEMSPEEMVALEASRETADTKRPAKASKTIKADSVKNTKGGTETPAKVSSNPNDPELQKLLQSV